jgi:hypothetical protein
MLLPGLPTVVEFRQPIKAWLALRWTGPPATHSKGFPMSTTLHLLSEIKTPLKAVQETDIPATKIWYLFDAEGNKLAITNKEFAHAFAEIVNQFGEMAANEEQLVKRLISAAGEASSDYTMPGYVSLFLQASRRITELQNLLKDIEHIDWPFLEVDKRRRCPVCGTPEEEGHAWDSDCRLAAALEKVKS